MDRLKQAFKWRAAIPWLLIIWKWIGHASSADFVIEKGTVGVTALWTFLQAHDWIYTVVGFLWLGALVLWHRKDSPQVTPDGEKKSQSRIPSNADQLVWNWRQMVTKAHNLSKDEGVSAAAALVRMDAFPSLRPHLSKASKDGIHSSQMPQVYMFPPAMDPLFASVLEDIDRKAKEWGLPTEPEAEADETEKLKEALKVSRGELQSLKRELQKQQEKDKPEDDLSDIPDMTYQLIRNSYPLEWRQRIALKRIWERQSIPLDELVLGLQNSGFADPDPTVRVLLSNKALVEWDGEKIFLKSSEVRRVLTKLFKETPLC